MSISSLSPNLPQMSFGVREVQPFQNAKNTDGMPQEVAKDKTVQQEFLKFARMNPAERIRASYLKEQGITEEELAAMPEKEREKIEEEIKRLIEQKLGKDHLSGNNETKLDIIV